MVDVIHEVSFGTRWATCAVGALVLIAACRDGAVPVASPTAPAPRAQLMTVLVGDAATHVRPDGSFRLEGAPTLAVPQIDATQAEKLAQAWALSSASMVLTELERQHGGKVDVPSLHSCGQTVYARSAFALLPVGEDPIARRSYGPQWITTLCGDANDPEVSVAVSALATDLTIQNGRIRFPQGVPLGEYVHWLGIPPGQTSLPITPEAAAIAGAQLTRRKIASVPELVAGVEMPGLARWHFRLDSAATLLMSRGRGQASFQHLYVGLDFASGKPLTTAPSAVQPDSVRIMVVISHARIGARYAGPSQYRPLYLHRNASYPLAFDTLAAPPGGL